MKRLLFLFLFLASFVKAQTPLTVRQGGSGRATLTANYLLIGNGTNPVTLLAPGTEGQVLSISGGVPSWQTISGGATAIGDAIGGGTTQRVLYIDGSGYLAQNANFLWDFNTYTLAVTNLQVNNYSVNINGVQYNFPASQSAANRYLKNDGSGNLTWAAAVTSVALSLPNIFSVSGSPVTTSGTLSATLASQLQNLVFAAPSSGSGTPSFRILASSDIPALNYENPLTFSTGLTRSVNTITVNTTQNITKFSNLTSNGFVKTSGGDGTLSIDGNTYLTGNESITLSGDVSGSGATAITTTIGNAKVTNAMLAGSIAYSKLSLTGAILNADLAGSIAYSKLSLTGAILNADLAGSIAYSKLSLTGAILNADLAGSIAYSKLSLTGAILNADLAGSIAASKLIGSDIATVGTITSGTWHGGTIDNAYLTNTAVANLSGTNTGDQTTVSGNAGTATALQTAHTIYGNSFNGTADLTQIIASTYGGTGNGFTKFTGALTSEKTYTLPNASAAILTDNAVVTVAQGGTGLATLTNHSVLLGAGTSNVNPLAVPAAGQVLTSVASSDPAWSATPSLGVSATTAGTLTLFGGTSGSVILQTAAVAGTGTVFQLPASNGTNGYVLQTNGSGVTSWVAASGGGMTNPMTTTGDIIYSSDGSGTPARLAIGTTGQFLGTAGTTPAWKTLAGTSNQITVSNSSGNLTLSTPQSIATSSSVQFGKIGLNQAVDATARIASTQTIAANTVADALILLNDGTASLGNQMYSGAIRFSGSGWATGGGSSLLTDWRIYNLPVQGSAHPDPVLTFEAQTSPGNGYNTVMSLSSGGTLTLPFTSSGLVTSNAGAITPNTLAANSIPYGTSTTAVTANSTNFTYNGTTQSILNPGITTTFTNALTLSNTTASTSGVAVQQSGSLRWLGHGWNTTATAADSTMAWDATVIPVSGATTSSIWKLRAGNGGSNMNEVFGVTSAGGVRVNASLLGTGAVSSSSTGVLSSGTLSVANGGTGQTSNTAGVYVMSGGVLTRVSLTTNGIFSENGGAASIATSTNLTYTSTAGLYAATTVGATNTIINVGTLDNKYTGATAVAGFGTGLLIRGTSSTTASQDMGRLTWDWVTATHASRASEEKHWGVFNASSLTDIGTWALTAATTATLTVGLAGTTKGILSLTGNTSGTITISPSATAGTQTYTIRDQGAAANFVLSNNSGGNASCGQATLTAGTVTVSTTFVAANSIILLTDATTGALANVGNPTVGTIVAGTSFVINSTNALDASTVNWMCINP